MELRNGPNFYGGSSEEFSAMGESLTEQSIVKEDGPWIVNFFSSKRISTVLFKE